MKSIMLSEVLISLALFTHACLANAENISPPLNLEIGISLDYTAPQNEGRKSYAHTGAEESALLNMLQNPISYEANPNGVYNYLWMRQFDQDYDQWEGPYAAFKMVQTAFKRGWTQYRNRNLAQYQFIPDGEGNGYVSGFDYNLRLSRDTLSLRLSYEF